MSNFKIIDDISNMQIRKDLPNFSSGDTIKVDVKIKDGNKYRIQSFEGIVIQRKGSKITQTVTVRKIFNSIGVERIFQIHSPLIEKITLLKKGRVRRAKIYYLRKLSGKAARIAEDKRQKSVIKSAV